MTIRQMLFAGACASYPAYAQGSAPAGAEDSGGIEEIVVTAPTSFQSFSRLDRRPGVFSGSITSEWTTPDLLEKSWSRSSRSSCSCDAER